MSFDLHLTLSDDSQELQVIHLVADREKITPEQAAARLLTEAARLHGQKTPAQEMLGSFSSAEDANLLDEAMATSRKHREQFDEARDLGI